MTPNPQGPVPPGGHIPAQAGPHSGPALWYAAPPPQVRPGGYPGVPPPVVPPGWRPGHPPPPPLSPAGQPLAEFSDRFLAGLVDYGIYFLVSMVFAVPTMIYYVTRVLPELFVVTPDGTLREPDFLAVMVPMLLLQLGLSVVLLAVLYVYHVEMMFRTGQTPGKRIMKIRVVPLDPHAALTRGATVKRYLVQFGAGSLVPGLSYLDGLWQLWDKPYQQCLHDKAARTVVVKVPRVNELRLAP
ncbi:putative RDD family membrane protein YckC [Micromonospora pisi]|uniref:Putative RDD family membrane protein YckC n=1 Tax=Micromonospora pisi TaxID=589240 RepID=A0A495JJS4_9ACTN|nr:putative RDD family membrane protein YckC [Micromonospora pisi]